MATIKDVCKAAGVSKATVSRVINGSEYVKDQTRESVLAAMKSLGYQPNAFARALATNSYNTFGLILPHFESHYFSSMLTEAALDMQKADKKLFVMNSSDNAEGEEDAVRSLNAHNCDAILVYSRHLSEQQLSTLQQEIKTQLIVINRALDDEKLFSFGFDQEQVARLATNYLLDIGHKHVACITTPMSSSTGHKRLSAYKEALKEHGVEVVDSLILEGESTTKSGYDATIKLIDSGTPFSAIFSCTDSMAIGAIRALHDRGIKVPEDISVIGIDGDPTADYIVPRLSTVTLPVSELTRDAVTTALTLNNEQQTKQKHFQYQGSLQIKESTQKVS
ncbi:LacI family DNA-binding transcriptional regulator [Vibrio sp. STUT-A11]|uniref:LacI family DNA-binding transcriptional regulator n=1 Tax=Vibrio sp. STUT-A11 TaxID=2976236 RepID=UPI0022314113|nr:LacI family DNA-binding transcriptional regulator [Vibrio sp. STUT-A11]BDR15733.1 LacI family transcriptional regulator [Vibrio sp. STUT-A11]